MCAWETADPVVVLGRSGVISRAIGLLYATNPGNLEIELSDVPDENSLITR